MKNCTSDGIVNKNCIFIRSTVKFCLKSEVFGLPRVCLNPKVAYFLFLSIIQIQDTQELIRTLNCFSKNLFGPYQCQGPKNHKKYLYVVNICLFKSELGLKQANKCSKSLISTYYTIQFLFSTPGENPNTRMSSQKKCTGRQKGTEAKENKYIYIYIFIYIYKFNSVFYIVQNQTSQF